MKANEYKDFINSLVDLLTDAGANEAATAWRGLVPLLVSQPNMTIPQLVKEIKKISPQNSAGGITIERIVLLSPSLLKLLDKRAKSAFITDTSNLIDALKIFRNFSIEEVIHCVIDQIEQEKQKKELARIKKEEKQQEQDKLIAFYVKELENSLGNEHKFPLCLSEILSKEKKLPAATIKKIAIAFTGKTASKINSKELAINAINQRHNNLILGKAKSEATAGRTAA